MDEREDYAELDLPPRGGVPLRTLLALMGVAALGCCALVVPAVVIAYVFAR